MRSIILSDREPVTWRSIDERTVSKESKPPSEEFLDAIHGGRGSLVVECGFCQRVYFGDGSGYDEGELERYEELEKANPDRYIGVGEDMITVFSINDVDYVEGCPCNGPRMFEVLFWNNRRQIIKYLKTRLKDNLKRAKYEADMLNGLEDDNG